MQIVTLSAAASLIKQECDQARASRRPFFFIVGAGVSHPPLPLAAEITNQCMREAKKYGRTTATAADIPINQYSAWFQLAYPAPVARQEYLRKLIVGKPISEANLRLAHILLARKIATTVVTPNFDDFLSRALTLFGVPHVLCDHPQTTERIDPDAVNDIQIVHVHGSYAFYDCCNLTGEVEARARVAPDTNFTMAFLLDSILRAHAPIVIGYSGWESDVIMSALRRRLQSALPHNLYWFCYSEADAETLPSWLKDHRNVFLVISRRGGDDAAAETTQTDDLSLPAKMVFDEIIRTFSLEPPLLTRDPLAFLSDHLKASLYGDVEEAADIYGIRSIVDRLERAKQFEADSQVDAAARVQLERVRDAIRTSAYDEAIAIAAAVRIEQLEPDDLIALSDLLGTIVVAGLVEPAGLAYDTMMRVYNALRDSGKIDENAWQQRTADALLSKADAVEGDDPHSAIVAYDEIITRFRDTSNVALRRAVAEALVGKATIQWYSLHDFGADGTAESVVTRYGLDDALAFQVARALSVIGDIAVASRDYERALTVTDDLLSRVASVPDVHFLRLDFRGRVRRAEVLAELGRVTEALLELDVVISQIAKGPQAVASRELMHRAFEMHAVLLERSGRVNEAFATLDRAITLLGDAKGTPNRQVARAWLAKAALAERTGRIPEAIAEYEAIVTRLRNASLRSVKMLSDQAAQALARLAPPVVGTTTPKDI